MLFPTPAPKSTFVSILIKTSQVLLLSFALFLCDFSIANAEESRALVPKGLCARTAREIKERLLQSPCIEGIAINTPWSACEPKDGEYDWSSLDRKVKQVGDAGKWVLLRVETGCNSFPKWMSDKCKTIKIVDTVKAHPTYLQEIEVPIPWDEGLLQYKTRLYKNIGKHYENNPTVRLMGISIANIRTDDWWLPTRMGNAERWKKAGYDPEKLISAGKQIIDTAAHSFPRSILLAIGEMKLDQDPLYVANTILVYAREKYPGRLFAQINELSALTVHGEKAEGMWGLLYKNRPMTGGQMLWGASDDSYRMNGKKPGDKLTIMKKALEAGLSYGMNYIEIYQRDALNPEFSDLLKEVNEKMTNSSKSIKH
jgi:hypothetical protein